MSFSIARSDDGHGGWVSVGRDVLALPPRQDLKVWKFEVEDPTKHAFEVSAGALRGQLADYRLTLSDCRCIHVVEYADHFLVHWDEVSPKCDLVEHARRDAPGYYVAGTTSVFAAIGAACAGKGNRAEGAALGALVGLFFGVGTL